MGGDVRPCAEGCVDAARAEPMKQETYAMTDSGETRMCVRRRRHKYFNVCT